VIHISALFPFRFLTPPCIFNGEMKTNLSLVKLALCGPGDVAKEITIAREVVTEWNLQHGESRGFWVKHQHWTTDSHPDMSERGQAVINRQMVDDSDVIVAVFWSRFGTTTGAAASGTEEEIRRGIKLSRNVMVYFSELEPLPANADKNQLDKLWAFRRELQTKGLCWKFSSRDQFKREFARHLSLTLNEFHNSHSKPNPAPVSQSIVGDGNYQAGGNINIFPKPPKVKQVIQPPPGSVLPADLQQIQMWIEDLAENTVGMARDTAFAMWGARLKIKFKVAKREQLASSQMEAVEHWYLQQRAIQTRGFKTKAPDEFKKRRISAIKAAMNQMGVTNEMYYPQLAKRLRMKETFTSLKDLTKRDLDRVYTMVMRDARGEE
jgi:hypothetical protein